MNFWLPFPRSVLLLACLLPATAFADLTGTVTLAASATPNLNLDTGATASAGGDVQFSSSGIAPVGSATMINRGAILLDQFNILNLLEVELWPGYSTAPITLATLETSALVGADAFYVHTNGGHYSAVWVVSGNSSSITLMFITFGVAGGGSSGGPPAITAIRNNSSNIFAGFPNYGITPSSIFIIIGSGLADAGQPVLQSTAAPGLPLTLNHASISATVGGVTVHPAIYYTSPAQIAAVLPASTPIGTGTLTVTYNGVASNAQPLVVAPAALGINTFYTNSAVATDGVTGALLTYTNSGTPKEAITLWTTGLGADPADSDTVFTDTPHTISTALQIYIGGAPATITYQGSSGYPGVDQVNVIIPPDTPDGCWTSVLAISGSGVLSNIDTIPVQSGGGPCVDSVSGLSGSQITPASRTLRTGLVALTQTAKVAANGAITYSTNSDAAFETYQGIYSPTNPISPGGCLVNNLTPVSPGTFVGLDAGSISLTGPSGIAVTLALQNGIKGAFNAALAAGGIPQSGGAFTFQGTGGADVGKFTSSVAFDNPILSWTNAAAAMNIQRNQGYTATWTGGNKGSYVFVTGTVASTATASAPSVSGGFTCLARAEDGQFTVPPYILSALPAGKGGVEIQDDIYDTLPATGLDIGLALGEIGISVTSTFQ